MAATRIRTRRGADPAAPTKPDGTRYRFELIDPDDRWRAYADEPADLVAELIPGYADADDGDRAAARLSMARRLRAGFQAELMASVDGREYTDEQQLALRGTGDPAAVTTWTTQPPLVLIEGPYRPAGPLPRPAAQPPAEILWIDPADDEALLRSLHYLGMLVLAERVADRDGGAPVDGSAAGVAAQGNAGRPG